LDTIVLFDGIAIFFVVFAHEMIPYPENPLFSLLSYLEYLSLSLFTFSSGYKLTISHSKDLDQRLFLSKYYLKRFIRLYKPYLGYTLLILIPLLVASYFAVHFFNLDLPGAAVIFTVIDNFTIFSFLGFLSGFNPISVHLWYLVALVVISSVCFTILYFMNSNWLFFSFIPFFLIGVSIQSGFIFFPFLITRILLYLPFFIFGMFWGYHQEFLQAGWFRSVRLLTPVLFCFFIIATLIFSNPINKATWIYFCCFLFPFLLLPIFEYVRKAKILYAGLMFCGIYSFQIYLFHEPLILPIISRIMIDFLKIDYFFMVIVISVFAIWACVAVYKIVKSIHLDFLFQ
jgi:peptidoglycan/LPS O-acetylase OafA/YrhL